MYDLCWNRVSTIAKIIDQQGPLYYDFESAIEYYKQDGTVEGKSAEVEEFNSLMEFVYLGRRPRLSDAKKNPDDYLTFE